MLMKSFRENVKFNNFSEQMLVQLFLKKFVQLFMKNVGSTFYLKNVVTFFKKILQYFYN
jgi:hypothetical protein